MLGGGGCRRYLCHSGGNPVDVDVVGGVPAIVEVVAVVLF